MLRIDRVAAVDSSSTANLTMSPSTYRPLDPLRGSSSSDPELDRSPSISIIEPCVKTDTKIDLSSRPSLLVRGSFSLANCISPKKRKPRFRYRLSRLERTFLFTIVFLSAVVIALLMSAYESNSLFGWKLRGEEKETRSHDVNSYYHANKSYCLSPNCVKVAASVIEAIDMTADPCDDFYVSIGEFESSRN